MVKIMINVISPTFGKIIKIGKGLPSYKRRNLVSLGNITIIKSFIMYLFLSCLKHFCCSVNITFI